ncbi:unnamed protein product [Protopolystoma xenopodis]|uniref:Uncharacterized protein n=1 Tax=Protopolystoma xenopodis TaxID=117903 RepID=A0A448XPE3_9PLAT|nr:unnamed protein product [Protopolystoma xenopodis]
MDNQSGLGETNDGETSPQSQVGIQQASVEDRLTTLFRLILPIAPSTKTGRYPKEAKVGPTSIFFTIDSFGTWLFIFTNFICSLLN